MAILKIVALMEQSEQCGGKYVWQYGGDNDLFRWTERSTNVYLEGSPLLMSDSFLKRDAGRHIKRSEKPLPKFFERCGIMRIGFSNKARGYFQMISRQCFITLFVVESGNLIFSGGGKKGVLARGDVLIAPPETDLLQIRAEKTDASILWAHIAPDWLDESRAEISVKKSMPDAETLLALAHAYECELFRGRQSPSVLANTAQSITEIMRRIACGSPSPDAKAGKIETELAKISAGKARFRSAAATAKSLAVSPDTLEKFCRLKYSLSFAKLSLKLRLDGAMQMLKNGAGVAETSKKFGYANQYAFSRAFKRHFGTTPSAARREKG